MMYWKYSKGQDTWTDSTSSGLKIKFIRGIETRAEKP
jgi:hypothetical protein